MGKSYWRFKTEKELGLSAIGWNDEGKMDYLFGTILPEDMEPFAEAKTGFLLENKNTSIANQNWWIDPSHLIKVDSSMKEESLTDALLKPKEEVSNQPIFDIDRLAKEVDDLFQSKVSSKTEELLQYTGAVTEAQLGEFRSKVLDSLEDYQKEVDQIFPGIKSRLLEEMQKGRTTIVMPDKTEITIEHMDHPVLEEVMQALIQQRKAMLVGPAGTGKTYMVGQVADRLKLPFYKYSCSRDSSVHDLLGYKQPKSETYLETAFLQAYENGGIFLVDEYDAMSGDMALFFNGVADGSKFISIPHRDTKPQAVKHEDFFLVMCGNTWGKGSTDYSGRDFQDLALMDRFRFCRFHVGYHEELEKNLMGANHDYAMTLRACLEELGSYLSTRNIEDISNLVNAGTSFDKITDRVTQDLTEDERMKVNRDIQKYSKVASKIGQGIVIDYKDQKIPLETLMKRYPITDKKLLKTMEKQSPGLYKEYMYTLEKEGLITSKV